FHYAGHAAAPRTDAGADRVHSRVLAPDGHLRAAARLAGDGLYLHRAVEYLRHLQLEQALYKAGMRPRYEYLRAAGGFADLHNVDLDAVPLVQLLALYPLARGEHGLRELGVGAYLDGDPARARLYAGDHAREYLVLLRGKLVIDYAPLRLADALDDDLLGGLGGDTAEFLRLNRDG